MEFFKKFFDRTRSANKSDGHQSALGLNPIPTLPPPSPELAKHARTGWVWELSDGEGATNSTRTGGRPMMGEDEIWPICGECKNALTFMMQCNLDVLPDGMRGHESGVLRFFYCLHDDCAGLGGWDAFDPQHHLSVLPTETYGHFQKAPKGTFNIAPQYLSKTTEVADYPHRADREGLYSPESDDRIYALPGHKYEGWPHWIQGAERPNCPDCDAVMEPFIQLDNNWNKDFNFGGGIGHISQCKTHTDNFAFGWACG